MCGFSSHGIALSGIILFGSFENERYLSVPIMSDMICSTEKFSNFFGDRYTIATSSIAHHGMTL